MKAIPGQATILNGTEAKYEDVIANHGYYRFKSKDMRMDPAELATHRNP